MNKLEKCLRRDCERPAVMRGLCNSDYNVAGKLVRDKKTTWDKLEKQNKAIPRRTNRRAVVVEWFLSGKP